MPDEVQSCRAAQQEAEAAAAGESRRLRRVAAQEALLKDTFLEAVEAEKERLLLARERGVKGKPATSPQARAVNLHVIHFIHVRLDQVSARYIQPQPVASKLCSERLILQ